MAGAPTGYQYNLANGISAFHTYVDVTFKLFTYLQLVAAAAVGFSWSENADSATVFAATLLVYAIFATGNLYLIVDAHERAALASEAILAFWRDNNLQIEPHFASLSTIYRAMKMWKLVTIHLFVDGFAVGAIIWRWCSVGR